MFYKKGALKDFAKIAGKHLCQSHILNKEKETLTQVFSCEFCEVFKKTFCTEHLWVTDSVKVTRKTTERRETMCIHCCLCAENCLHMIPLSLTVNKL